MLRVLRAKLMQGWGKLRRRYLLLLRPGYVRASLSRRRGACHRTGACCNLLIPCPLFERTSTPGLCRIYSRRPKACRTFPIDERDLRDRNRVMPDHPCGFWFEPADAVRPAAPPSKVGSRFYDLLRPPAPDQERKEKSHAQQR